MRRIVMIGVGGDLALGSGRSRYNMIHQGAAVWSLQRSHCHGHSIVPAAVPGEPIQIQR